MKKEEIAFMLKNGFTVNEVMAMCGGNEQEQEQEQEQETESELVATLKAELAKMREERQKQNRKDKIIDTLPENEKTEEEKVNEAVLKIYEDSLK